MYLGFIKILGFLSENVFFKIIKKIKKFLQKILDEFLFQLFLVKNVSVLSDILGWKLVT